MKLSKKFISIFMSTIFVCSVSRISSEDKSPRITKDKNFMYTVNDSDDSAILIKVNSNNPIALPANLDSHNITEVASRAALQISDDRHLMLNLALPFFQVAAFPLDPLFIFLQWQMFYQGSGVSFKQFFKDSIKDYKESFKELQKTGIFSQIPVSLNIKTNKIISINLPYCKKIGERAFLGSFSLTHANLPQCTELSDSCFAACLNLKSINLDEFSGKIPENCFKSCFNLENLNISDCSSIGDYAFSGCALIKNINFPNCSEVGEGAFEAYQKDIRELKTVDMEDNIEDQGKKGSFKWKSYIRENGPALEEVQLPKCSKIGALAFIGCNNLKTIVCPNVESIGGLAFKDCKSLKSLNFPKASNLGYNCFLGCEALESINLSESCTLIPLGTFNKCAQLKTLSLPEVQRVGQEAFGDCKSLEEIKIPKCSTVDSHAFINCSNLKRLDLPEVKEIGLSAFKNCENLEEVYIPNCTKISSEAFKNCGKLKKMTISSSCEVGQSALPYDKLVSKDFELIRK